MFNNPFNHNHNETIKVKLTFGQRLADTIAKWGGSWSFLIFLSSFLAIWMTLNVIGFVNHWDPFPFILLNLSLSTLATYQAPIILMAQNRSAERDRHQAERDYAVNRKAEREVENMQSDLDEIKESLREHHLLMKEQHTIKK